MVMISLNQSGVAVMESGSSGPYVHDCFDLAVFQGKLNLDLIRALVHAEQKEKCIACCLELLHFQEAYCAHSFSSLILKRFLLKLYNKVENLWPKVLTYSSQGPACDGHYISRNAFTTSF